VNDPDAGSTVPRRQLGRELRTLRTEAGLTLEAAAHAIGRSTPTLWRMEKGATPMRPGDVAGICRVYGADDRHTEALMALAAETRAPGWWRSRNGVIPRWFDTFIGLEQAAHRIRVYDAEFMPGLLQTERYADATFRAICPRLHPEERAEMLAVRMRRQKVLTRRTPKPPMLDVILGEAALQRTPRDRSAMAEQLQRLADATRMPNVSVRILPLSAALEVAPDSRFILLSFPLDRRGRSEPPVAYTDSLTGALYLTDPAEVEAYDAVWEAIGSVAYDRDESFEAIWSIRERFDV
jgi:transcriptional regulator with XRE-family HTH domain